MTSNDENKLRELSENLLASLCCGPDLPENDCTLEEILEVIKEAYNINSERIIWHKFPDELPEDLQDVLTVSLNHDGTRKIYHTFTFGEKATVELLLKKHHRPSMAFIQWNAERCFDIVAWCEIPEYHIN